MANPSISLGSHARAGGNSPQVKKDSASRPICPAKRQFGRCFFLESGRKLMIMKTAKQPGAAMQAKPARSRDETRGNAGLQNKLGPQTRAVHGGEPERHGVNGPVVTEIIRTSTFTFSNTEEMKEWAEGKNKAYIYTRYGNPTLSVAEKKIAALEGAEAAVVAASGMAAISSSLLA